MKLIFLLFLGITLSGCIAYEEDNAPYPGAFNIIEIAPDFTKYHFYDENITCIVFDDAQLASNLQCFEGLK